VSSAEAIIIDTAASLAVLRSVALRVGDRLAGRHPVLRQQEAWDLNAAFVRSLGLDPALVLPARPVVPAAEVAGTPALAALGA
jgi:hypothetical protein